MMTKIKIIFIVALYLIFGVRIMIAAQEPERLLEQAKIKLRAGEYLEARKLLQPWVENSTEENYELIVDYLETFLARGEYKEGINELNSYKAKGSDNPYFLYVKGRLLKAIGQYQDAGQAFAEAQTKKEDFFLNDLYLGELLEITGQKEKAYGYYEHITNAYHQNRFKSAETLGIAGKAFANLGDFHEANRVFRAAYALDAQNVQNLFWWGDLFREKFNTSDARRTFEEALSLNSFSAELYIGYASTFESFAQKEVLANKALEENPNCIDAMNMLAEIQILDGQYNKAEELLQKALAINPNYEYTHANFASVYHLRNDKEKFAQTEQKVHSINSQCTDFYTILAENCISRFRYKDAVFFCREAIAKDWRNWHAYALLGLNILRVGEVIEASRYLERGFKGDPFNLYARNTLELLDEYKDFKEIESEHFVLIMHQSESDILSVPVLLLAEECYDSLSVRYTYRPEQKIRIEAYNDHDDFAVRISGLPGIGLLGVCFGDVVAFDTPMAQQGREHNWSRTLWHELAHVMALGLSDQKVPRWFTEGLSVYEEKLARPEWGRDMELELYIAVEKDLIFSLKEINKGFTRPKFPDQIMLTYYQSAKLVEYIANHFGFKAIIDMLAEFGAGNNMEDTFLKVLNTTPDELEKMFLDDLKIEMQNFALAVSGTPQVFDEEEKNESFFETLFSNSDNPFFNSIKEGNEFLKKGELENAEQQFIKAMGIFPNYTRVGNPYLGLAAIYRQKGDQSKLIQILGKYLNVSEYGAKEAKELAQIYADKGNIELAQYYFTRSMQVEPYDLNTHSQLAELHKKLGLYSLEAIERRAILALDPIDRAKAYYYLALSLYNSGKVSDAKTEVLRSLEIASGYREAQKLLLKCLGN